MTGEQMSQRCAEGHVVAVPVREGVLEGVKKLSEQHRPRAIGRERSRRRLVQIDQLRAARVEVPGTGVARRVEARHHEVVQAARLRIGGGFGPGLRVVVHVLRSQCDGIGALRRHAGCARKKIRQVIVDIDLVQPEGIDAVDRVAARIGPLVAAGQGSEGVGLGVPAVPGNIAAPAIFMATGFGIEPMARQPEQGVCGPGGCPLRRLAVGPRRGTLPCQAKGRQSGQPHGFATLIEGTQRRGALIGQQPVHLDQAPLVEVQFGDRPLAQSNDPLPQLPARIGDSGEQSVLVQIQMGVLGGLCGGPAHPQTPRVVVVDGQQAMVGKGRDGTAVRPADHATQSRHRPSLILGGRQRRQCRIGRELEAQVTVRGAAETSNPGRLPLKGFDGQQPAIPVMAMMFDPTGDAGSCPNHMDHPVPGGIVGEALGTGTIGRARQTTPFIVGVGD